MSKIFNRTAKVVPSPSAYLGEDEEEEAPTIHGCVRGTSRLPRDTCTRLYSQ